MNAIIQKLQLSRLKALIVLGCYLCSSGIYLFANGAPTYIKKKLEHDIQSVSELPYQISYIGQAPLFFGDELDFDLYPNPSKGGKINLEIKGIESNKLEITLYNTIGKVIERKSLSIITPFASVSLEAREKLNPGLYFVSISAADGQKVSKKLVVIE